MIQHLDQVTDEHSATWYLIYREKGSKTIYHKVFNDYWDACAELNRHFDTNISNANEIIIRPYRLSQNIQVA